MKVAIVSFEFEGLTKNGGIGTAYRRLAEQLASERHQVTVVFMPFGWNEDYRRRVRLLSREIRALARKGISVVMPELRARSEPRVHGPFNLRRSYLVYEYLREGEFDLVHAPDNCAFLFFSLLARKLELDFATTRFVIGAHGSPVWAAEANSYLSSSAALVSELDRRSIEMSDAVVSPSAYMVRYMRRRRWKLPKKTIVIPNVNRLSGRPNRAPDSRPKEPQTNELKTLIFFGRLESRKGVYLFADALGGLLERNPKLGRARPLRVVFVGKDQRIDRPGAAFASELIRSSLSRFGGRLKLEFHGEFSSEQSLAYLKRQKSALVCMPSLVDNSPYVVVEAIELGLNFICTASGGQAELIDPRDRKNVLCRPEARDLARLLAKRIQSAPVRVRASRQALKANAEWSRLHSSLARSRAKRKHPLRGPRRAPSRGTRVSIVIGLRGGAEHQLRSLSSILKQKYSEIELCVPRRFTASIPSNRRRTLKFRRFDARAGVSGSCAAAQTSSGKYILFLDGAELADRDALARWVSSAEGRLRHNERALGFSCIRETPGNPRHWTIPAGVDDVLHALTGEHLPNPHTLWLRRKLVEHGRGLSEDFFTPRGLAMLQFSGLAKGESIVLIPRAWISSWDIAPWSLSVDANDPKLFERLLESLPPERRDLFCYVSSVQEELRRTRQKAYEAQRQVEELKTMRVKLETMRKKALSALE